MTGLRPDHRAGYPVSLAAGGLTTLAFAPYGLTPLAVLMPAVLIGLWLHATPRAAFAQGYLFGLGLFGTGVSWVHISINLFGGVSLPLAALLTFVFVAYLSLYPALAGYLLRRLFRHSGRLSLLLVVIPALWVVVEWLRGWVFTGFPWLNLGYSQIGLPLDGLAPLAGVYAVSWATVFTACALAGLILCRGRRLLLLGAASVLWLAAWLAGGVSWTDRVGEPIQVALVQGAVPQEVKWDPAMRRPSLDLYLDLTRPYLSSDLIIWPETAIPAFYHQVGAYLDTVADAARRHGSRILVGIPVSESGRLYNSIVSLAGPRRFYHKRHLVPFGEYMPFGNALDRLLRLLGIPKSNFSPGPDVPPLLRTDGMTVGVFICYEAAFGEEVIEALPEARVLVNISNDAWFGDSAAAHQHLQMARMRSRETGRYMLRATNTGISAFIDERGNVLAATPQFEPVVLARKAELRQGITPYGRVGNYVIIGLCLLLLGDALRRSRGAAGAGRGET